MGTYGRLFPMRRAAPVPAMDWLCHVPPGDTLPRKEGLYCVDDEIDLCIGQVRKDGEG